MAGNSNIFDAVMLSICEVLIILQIVSQTYYRVISSAMKFTMIYKTTPFTSLVFFLKRKKEHVLKGEGNVYKPLI